MMTPKEIQDTAALYIANLYAKGYGITRVDPEKQIADLSKRQVMNHCTWMCWQIEKMAEAEPARAQQWLGFVQGCLFLMGDYTIDDFRKHGGVKSIP